MRIRKQKNYNKFFAGLAAAGLVVAIAPNASAVRLDTAELETVLEDGMLVDRPTDGNLSVRVNMYGAFGSRSREIGGDANDAFFNPVGAFTAEGTTFESAVAFRSFTPPGRTSADSVADAGPATWLTSGNIGGFPGGLLPAADEFTSPMPEGRIFEVTSEFGLFDGGVEAASAAPLFGVKLRQVVRSKSELIELGADGSADALLTQVYEITNNGVTGFDIELVRYFDGDLTYSDADDSTDHDGGLKTKSFQAEAEGDPDGVTVLAQTDTPTGRDVDSTYVGITANLGRGSATAPAGVDGLIGPLEPIDEPDVNHFSINSFPDIRSNISTGILLDDMIFGDEDPVDEAVDVDFLATEGATIPGYDVSLGLAGRVFIDAGETITFLTHTVFGTGDPDAETAGGIGCLPNPLQDCIGATSGTADGGPTTDGPTTDGPTTDGPTTDGPTTGGGSAAVPEPLTVSLGMVGLAAAGIAAGRRRR